MSTMPGSQEEIYPMASFPTLIVSDITSSARWYCEVLGFTNIFTMPGLDEIPSMVHLRWVKYADLILFPDRYSELASAARGIGVSLNYSVGDVDQLAERAREFNATILEGPVNRPWNVRELVLLDPDGYRLVFNGPIPSGQKRTFDEILADAEKGFTPG